MCPSSPVSAGPVFKYTWNNFLHLQVGALHSRFILSHAAQEDRAAASGPEGALASTQPGTQQLQPQPQQPPESTMVTYVSPCRVMSCRSPACSLASLCALSGSTQAVCTGGPVGSVWSLANPA